MNNTRPSTYFPIIDCCCFKSSENCLALLFSLDTSATLLALDTSCVDMLSRTFPPHLLTYLKLINSVSTMVFTIGTLFEAALLLVNAIAILNEERFLAKGIKRVHLAPCACFSLCYPMSSPMSCSWVG